MFVSINLMIVYFKNINQKFFYNFSYMVLKNYKMINLRNSFKIIKNKKIKKLKIVKNS